MTWVLRSLPNAGQALAAQVLSPTAPTKFHPSRNAQNENPPRISPGGPTSSAPSQLPVHPRSATLSRATIRNIGCNRDESMTAGAFACAIGHEVAPSFWSNNLCGEKQRRILSAPQLLSAGSSGGLGAIGIPRKLTRKDGWRLQRIPRDAGAMHWSERRRERRPRPCEPAVCADAISRKRRGRGASSMLRVARADIGTRSSRSNAECGSCHSSSRLRAGSAGANLQSREGALRLIDPIVTSVRPVRRCLLPSVARPAAFCVRNKPAPICCDDKAARRQFAQRQALTPRTAERDRSSGFTCRGARVATSGR